MENHYKFVKEIRRKMRLEEQIPAHDLIDYYWSLHRLHEDQANKSDLESKKETHLKKAFEYKIMAEEFEENVYPGLAQFMKDGIHRIDSKYDKKREDYSI